MTASPPSIHQDQRSDKQHDKPKQYARDHHVILCNTACFATWGSA